MKKIVVVVGLLVLFLQSGLLAYAQEEPKKESSDVAIEQQVDQIMEKYIGKGTTGASIGIVKDGKIILTKGYGVSDIEKKTPVTADKTVFEVGSVTKLFTYSMLMKLAEAGKVKLDADIQDYLPEGTLNLAFDKKITILDLMHHTAGFEESLEGIKLDNVDQLKPLKETITKEQPKQVYEPGTVTAYSNFGTALAGYIIERVTGQDYITYMKQALLEPLQMNRSTFSMDYDNQPEIKDNVSVGHVSNGSSFDVTDRFISNIFPAGSLLSTATDMTNFMMMQLGDDENYKFFKQPETLKLMQTHSYGVIPGTPGNAHGFWEQEVNNKRIVGHNGGTLGFRSELSLVPEEGLGIVLLTNSLSQPDVAGTIQKEIETLLLGKYPATADLPLKKSPTDKKVVGRYRTSRRVYSTMAKLTDIIMDADMIITENKEGGINLKMPGEKEVTSLVEVKPGVYQVAKKKENAAGENYLYFEFNEKGQVLRIAGDFLPVTSFLDTQVFNLAAFVISLISFLGSLIYLLVKYIKQKRNKKADGWSRNYTLIAVFSAVALFVLGLATAMLLRFLSNPMMIISSMQPLFYINWLLPLFTAGMIIWLAINWRKNEAKWLTLFLIIIGLLTTVLFYNAHLFF